MIKKESWDAQIMITSADTEATISRYAQSGIPLNHIRFIDCFTVIARINPRNYRTIKEISSKKGEMVKLIFPGAAVHYRRKIMKRPIPVLGAVLIFALSLYISGHVLFYDVTGNHVLSKNVILDSVQECGLKFGMNTRQVNSEALKNAMLQNLPRLQWVGITTRGAAASICVKEKVSTETPQKNNTGVASMVAVRDGLIEEMTVLSGSPLLHVGQAVKKGETIISGYTDCGRVIRASRADGEVYARTLREITAILPDPVAVRQKTHDHSTDISLQVGKKIIKLWNRSGISPRECVRMYEEYSAVLPGGYVLPVKLHIYRDSVWKPAGLVPSQGTDYKWLSEQVKEYVLSSMIAGRILDSGTQSEHIPGAQILSGKYHCREMIGQMKNEEKFEIGTKNN